MNNYETVFIVTPVLSDAQVQEVADKFQGVITENGGQNGNREAWGLKKSAYPIPGSYTHLRAHETLKNLVCRLLLAKQIKQICSE